MTSEKKSDAKTGKSESAAAKVGEAEDGQRSPEEIQADIEETREQLGDTTAELAGKADVRGQAKGKVEDARESVLQKKDELTGKAKDIGSKAQDAAPDSVGAGASCATAAARENPAVMIIAAVFAGGLLLGLILRR